MLWAVLPLVAQNINVDKDGFAVKGYDPVAYFLQGKPVQGHKEIAFLYKGATYLFSSTENREIFRKTPLQYIPQYNGYCAWAVKQGYIADINPKAWVISQSRLFLNYNRTYQKRFEKNLQENIKQADVNWPDVRKKISSTQ